MLPSAVVNVWFYKQPSVGLFQPLRKHHLTALGIKVDMLGSIKIASWVQSSSPSHHVIKEPIPLACSRFHLSSAQWWKPTQQGAQLAHPASSALTDTYRQSINCTKWMNEWMSEFWSYKDKNYPIFLFWLKAIEIYFLTVLEARVQNQGVGCYTLPLKALGEDPSLPLPASGGSRCSRTCGCITPISASVFTWPSLLCFCPQSSIFKRNKSFSFQTHTKH